MSILRDNLRLRFGAHHLRGQRCELERGFKAFKNGTPAYLSSISFAVQYAACEVVTPATTAARYGAGTA